MKNDKEKFKIQFNSRIYKFILKLVEFIDKLPRDNTTQIIAKQLIRSATSIGANHTEAQASSSRKEFINFFHYSLKSANESKFWLSLLMDAKKSNFEKTNALLSEVKEISNILASSLLTLKKRR